MDRRTFVTMAVLGFGGLAGCTGAPPPGDSTETTTTQPGTTRDTGQVVTGYAVSESVEPPDVEQFSDLDAWGVFIGSRAVADEYFNSPDVNTSEPHLRFIEETDFDHDETLVFVQAYGPQTCYALELVAPPTTTENNRPHISLSVERTAGADEACGDAMTPVGILLRLSFDPEHGHSDVVAVTVNSYKDTPEELQLELETAVALS